MTIAATKQAMSLTRRQRLVLGLSVGLALAGVGGGAVYYRVTHPTEHPLPSASPDASLTNRPGEDAIVRFAQSKWPAAGIRVDPAVSAPFTERAWRSGRLALDESRIAHISPIVEGVVREVKVRLGRNVTAGEVLAVLDCREVGQAKLELVKARLAAEYARTQQAWTRSTSLGAVELVAAMTAGTPLAEIEKRFRDRPIGDLRQQLVTAYSRQVQTKAHYEAATQPGTQGAIPESTLIRLRADEEAAEATFRALCEEVKFQSGQLVRAAEQKLREAETAESLARSGLMMFGYSREEVAAMDPIVEGPKVSLYPIRAPFAGTVLSQHAVLAERVGPQIQMFQLADLTTLWLQADVPPRDVPLVRQATGHALRFRIGEDGGPAREAEVFYTGDVVDKDTRAVALTAAVPNPDRALKPGMFVEVELTRPGGTVVQIPESAVQRQGTQAFVFVHVGGDEFRRVDVKLGRSSGGNVEVVAGLQAGQPVVVAGGFVLKSELFKDLIAGE